MSKWWKHALSKNVSHSHINQLNYKTLPLQGLESSRKQQKHILPARNPFAAKSKMVTFREERYHFLLPVFYKLIGGICRITALNSTRQNVSLLRLPTHLPHGHVPSAMQNPTWWHSQRNGTMFFCGYDIYRWANPIDRRQLFFVQDWLSKSQQDLAFQFWPGFGGAGLPTDCTCAEDSPFATKKP